MIHCTDTVWIDYMIVDHSFFSVFKVPSVIGMTNNNVVTLSGYWLRTYLKLTSLLKDLQRSTARQRLSMTRSMLSMTTYPASQKTANT